MARRRKEGRRATGIQARNGMLYIITSKPIFKDGKTTYRKYWISTGLKDTADNIPLATAERERILHPSNSNPVDFNTTLSNYIERFLKKKKREISDTTYSSYFYRARHIQNHFQDIKLKAINEPMVERFLDELFTVHHVQPRTAKDIKVLFGNIMDQACKDGIIAYNPVKEVIIDKKLSSQYAKEKNMDDNFFSFEEAQLFLSKAKDHELYELFYLTLFFGLRREEVLGLRWQSVNLKEKRMVINHTVTKGTTITRANTTKTIASAREYPLSDEQILMFQNLKEKEIANRELFGDCYVQNDYIFKHVDGSPYYPDYPSKAFGKIIKRNTDLPQGITFHGLRSSCVSILVHRGMDVKSIQKWVGHADIDTTLRIYAKVKDKAAKREISNAMTDLIQLKDYTD